MSSSQDPTHNIGNSSLQILKRDSKTADLIFGSLAGFLGRLIEHPFDTLKVRLQTSNEFSGAVDCFRKTASTEGLLGLYKGLSTPLYGSLLENAVIFTAYNSFQGLIKDFHGMDSTDTLTVSQLCLAGSLSGATISFILTPIELIKCNLQVQDVSALYSNNSKQAPQIRYSGPMEVFTSTIKQKGFRGMYQGHLGTLLRESVGGAAWFGSYETVCSLLIKRQQRTQSTLVTKMNLHPLSLMTAGAVAGMTFNAAFFSADVVKSRVQTQGLQGASDGFFQVARELYRVEGVRGFFRGFTMTILRSAPTSACIFATYELLNRHFAK